MIIICLSFMLMPGITTLNRRGMDESRDKRQICPRLRTKFQEHDLSKVFSTDVHVSSLLV